MFGKNEREAQFDYRIVRSRRRTIAIHITDTGVEVRAPLQASERSIQGFVTEKEAWIQKHLEQHLKRQEQSVLHRTVPAEEERQYRKLAAAVISGRVEHFAQVIGEFPQRITIRDQKTRWGSCSSKRNLNFNWRLMLVPPELMDYVVVHELCHLKEMNHSRQFWELVAAVLPDYKERKKRLREC